MSQAERDFMQDLGKVLDSALEQVEKISKEHTCMLIISFGDGEDAPVSMVSNATREHAAQAMASVVKYWEEGYPDVPLNQVN